MEYQNIVASFKEHLNSFKDRKKRINSISFSKVNWSDSYLDFVPYISVINQLKRPQIFKSEKTSSIKNHFLDGKLIYCFRNENENWGSVFIDYKKNTVKWLFFSENYDDEIILQQLKIAQYQNNKVVKVISYLLDKDAGEETFMIDLFDYNNENKLDSIVRNGFYEMKANVLPERKISFIYDKGKVYIYSSPKTGDIKKLLIYEGKELH